MPANFLLLFPQGVLALEAVRPCLGDFQGDAALAGEFTGVAGNAIRDLRTRSTARSYVPEPPEEMSRAGVDLHLVAYSTIELCEELSKNCHM